MEMIEPHSIETTLQGSIQSLREVVDVQRARADKAEAKPGSTDGPGRVALGRVILIVGAVGML